MKLRILASAAALGLLAAPAYADDTDSDQITIQGKIGKTCVLGGSPALAVDLDALDGLNANAFAVALTPVDVGPWGDSYCNTAHDLTLTSANQGLTTTASAAFTGSDAFAEKVDYTAVVAADRWGAGGVSLDTEVGATKTTDVTGAFRNDNDSNTNAATTQDGLLVVITTKANTTAPLLFGDYEDTLTLELAAQ